jgi:hypothetical protein
MTSPHTSVEPTATGHGVGPVRSVALITLEGVLHIRQVCLRTVAWIIVVAVFVMAALTILFEVGASRRKDPMSDTSSTSNGRPPEGINRGASTQYVQHPKSAHLGERCFVTGKAPGPIEVHPVLSTVYDRLSTPRTKADLVSVLRTQPDPVVQEAAAQIDAILQAMVEHGLIVEIPPGSSMPPEGPALARDLLWKAEQRLRAGDWTTAEALCREAGKEPAFAAVAELDALIARYEGGRLDGLVEQACLLSAQLTPPAQVCCDGLGMLAAHRTADRATAKRIALHLARHFESPWDLPTVPQFAVLAQERITVAESKDVGPVLAVIEDLLASGIGTGEENVLLEALAQRYRERGALSCATPPGMDGEMRNPQTETGPRTNPNSGPE